MRLTMESSGSNSGKCGKQQQQQSQQKSPLQPPMQQLQQTQPQSAVQLPRVTESGPQQQQQQQQQQQPPNGSPPVGHTNGASAGASSSSAASGGRAFRSKAASIPLCSASTSMSPYATPPYRYSPPSNFPLRIFVLKDLVGAIIGRGGGTIRQITQETHARVDVHRKDNSNPNENVIVIYGNPDNCSQACKRILEVMQQEAKSLNRTDEIGLKILAPNNLIGRIIGKGGATIKRIMQQTDTKITVSNTNVTSSLSMNPERVITISGTLENMCRAEVLISQKLRQCVENDMLHYQQSMVIYGGMPPMSPVMSAHTPPVGGLGSVYPGGSASSAGQQGGMQYMYNPQCSMVAPGTGASLPGTPPYCAIPSASSYYSPYLTNTENVKETVSLFVPNSVVGAIIGRGGATIRQMMNSGALIKVAQMNEEDCASTSTASTSAGSTSSPSSPESVPKFLERRVTIIGTPSVQNLAQYYIFQKVMQELHSQATMSASQNVAPTLPLGLYGEPSILRAEITVPTNQIRRIIGKGGSVIQELQRNTGATIKLAKESSATQLVSPDVDKASTSSSPASPASDLTNVHIIGDYFSSIAAQRQIRLIVQKSMSAPAPSTTVAVPSSVASTSQSRPADEEGGVEAVAATAGDTAQETPSTVSETASKSDKDKITSSESS